MNDIDAITPVKDVWLRPRRVFRELAARPIGTGDWLLACLQGVADYVVASRFSPREPHATPQLLVLESVLVGSCIGLARTAFWAFVYNRFGTRMGGKASFAAVFHVLSFGAVPRVAALILWAGIALVVGKPAFLGTPPAGTDAFVAILMRAEIIAVWLSIAWATLLQVMGLSEVFNFKLAKAFGLWLLGQLLALLIWSIAVSLSGQM